MNRTTRPFNRARDGGSRFDGGKPAFRRHGPAARASSTSISSELSASLREEQEAEIAMVHRTPACTPCRMSINRGLGDDHHPRVGKQRARARFQPDHRHSEVTHTLSAEGGRRSSGCRRRCRPARTSLTCYINDADLIGTHFGAYQQGRNLTDVDGSATARRSPTPI